MKKRQVKFYPDEYKNCIGKSYNDYAATRQMNLFEDLTGYSEGASADQSLQEGGAFNA